MNKLWSFLRYRASMILYYAITSVTLLAVSFLTDLPTSVALYLILLFTFTLLVMLLFDGVRYHRTLAALRAIAADARGIADRLPAPANAIEEECCARLAELDAACESLRRRMDARQAEQLTYYTLWVHQIKTPIAAMRLVLHDMDGREATALSRELFTVERYVDLALRYVKLTDIASDLVIAPCEIADVVRESVKKFAIPFVYRKLTVDVRPMRRTVLTDSRWLAFILEQIVSNAVKYTERGGVTISLADNRLTIADTGVGIRAEDLPRIFEKGYTGFNGRVDTRASGVGLYLAKRAADALSIGLSVESRLHAGTSVTLLLPDEAAPLE